MPSGAQCVLSMFVSQINCIVSLLCLLLTGWTSDKFSLSQEAVAVSVTCLFTSWSPSNNAKRLTINCCHCILSLFPITCASLQQTHRAYRSTVRVCVSGIKDIDTLWTAMDIFNRVIFHLLKAEGFYKCMNSSLQGWVKDVWRETVLLFCRKWMKQLVSAVWELQNTHFPLL